MFEITRIVSGLSPWDSIGASPESTEKRRRKRAPSVSTGCSGRAHTVQHATGEHSIVALEMEENILIELEDDVRTTTTTRELI